MRGFAMLNYGESGFVEKEAPHAGCHDAIVRPLVAAICREDLRALYEGSVTQDKNRILGHQAVGEVVEVGCEVHHFKPGDIVIVSAVTPDWESEDAQRGMPMHSGGLFGGWKFVRQKDGVFADFFHVNNADANMVHLPSWLDMKQAVFLPVVGSFGIAAAEIADIHFGDRVAIIGSVSCSIVTTQAAALRGAGQIVICGHSAEALDIAKKVGATNTFHYKGEPFDKDMWEVTEGQGFDSIIITNGPVEILEGAINLVKPGGTIASINFYNGNEIVPIPLEAFGYGLKNFNIRCTMPVGGSYRLHQLLQLVKYGRLDLSHFGTHEFHGLDEVPDALDLLLRNEHKFIQPIIYFD